MPCTRHASLGTILLLAGLAACETGSDPTPLADQPKISAASTKASTLRHFITFKGAIPDRFDARVQALGGKVALKENVLGFASVTGISDQDARSLVTDGLAATADEEPIIQLGPYATQKPTARLPAATPQSPTNPAAALLFSTLPLQWNMIAVHADEAWAAGKLGSASTKVAILDTGLDYTHPDLAGHVDLTNSVDLVGETDTVAKYVGAGRHPITDLNSHGSHVGTVVSSNAFITAGITSMTTLVGVKVCTMRGSCPVSSVLAGIRYASDLGVAALNLSIAGGISKSAAPGIKSFINRAINYAQQHDVLIVVAAGNLALDLDRDGNFFSTYCDAPHVVCVSASGPTGEGALGPYVNVDAFGTPYSNFGRSGITVAAPGGNLILNAQGAQVDLTPVWGTCSTTAQAFASLTPPPTEAPTGLLCPPAFLPVIGFVGTSQAASHVTGLAASLAAEGVSGPSQLRAAIIKGADDLGPNGTDPFYGRGRINVAASLGVE